MITIPESCRHTFSDAEMTAIAKELAMHMTERSSVEAEFESVKSAHKARITRLTTDVDECARRITEGFEMVDVQCIVLKFRPDVDHKMIVRTDTGLVLRLEKLKADEKQMKLTTKEPETWAWEADFYSEEKNGAQRMVAANVGLSNEEYKALKDAGVRGKSKRKALGAASTEK